MPLDARIACHVTSHATWCQYCGQTGSVIFSCDARVTDFVCSLSSDWMVLYVVMLAKTL